MVVGQRHLQTHIGARYQTIGHDEGMWVAIRQRIEVAPQTVAIGCLPIAQLCGNMET